MRAGRAVANLGAVGDVHGAVAGDGDRRLAGGLERLAGVEAGGDPRSAEGVVGVGQLVDLAHVRGVKPAIGVGYQMRHVAAERSDRLVIHGDGVQPAVPAASGCGRAWTSTAPSIAVSSPPSPSPSSK